jgi:hypothetical protein
LIILIILIGALCYHNLVQHHYDLTACRVKLKMNLPPALGLDEGLTILHHKRSGAKKLHIRFPPWFTLAALAGERNRLLFTRPLLVSDYTS